MSSLIRFSFVVFLVMLQLVAPLIHAHKNEKGEVASSFHLPEFEQVNALLEKNSNLMIAPSFHEGEIVTISSGVKENQRRFSSEDEFHIFTLFSFLLFFVTYQTAYRTFFIEVEPLQKLRFFNLTSPRAPPFFSV